MGYLGIQMAKPFGVYVVWSTLNLFFHCGICVEFCKVHHVISIKRMCMCEGDFFMLLLLNRLRDFVESWSFVSSIWIFNTVRLFLLFKIAYLTWYLPLVKTTAIFSNFFFFCIYLALPENLNLQSWFTSCFIFWAALQMCCFTRFNRGVYKLQGPLHMALLWYWSVRLCISGAMLASFLGKCLVCVGTTLMQISFKKLFLQL